MPRRKAQNKASTTATFRISFDSSGSFVYQDRHPNGISSLTLYVRGTKANGNIVADILRQCHILNNTSERALEKGTELKRLIIERKDNDWDAPATLLLFSDGEEIGNALLAFCQALETLTVDGIASPMDVIFESLCKLPNLRSVSISVDPHYARHNNALAILDASSMEKLLRKGKMMHRLSLIGAFPESAAYTSPLHDSVVKDGSCLHLFVHFQQQLQPSPFCYFLRQVMETNQLGRLDQPQKVESLKKLVEHLRKRSTSLDAIYLIMRENPSLCHRNRKQKGTPGIMTRVRRFLGRARLR